MENNIKNIKFRTNINCSSCVESVKPYLDNTIGVCEWNVDTTNREKILTVKSDSISDDKIIETVQKAGFKIELLNE